MATEATEVIAYNQGRDDILADIKASLAEGPLNIGEARMVLDGSQYSPSHRRLAHGAYWWNQAETNEAAWESYTQGVDWALDNNEAVEHGLSVYWDEGCLWIEAPGPDDEIMEDGIVSPSTGGVS